jgi:hypothetical protein
MEVVGALWATLELTQTALVVNVSATGLLLESPTAVAQESVQPLSLLVDGNELTVAANVRRVERVAVENGPPRYYLGLDFISPPVRLVQAIEELATHSEDA